MPQFSDSNQSGTSTPSDSQLNALDTSLEAGLEALEHKNYAEAIAHLEVVYQNTERRSVRLKAQMALVKAYEGNGEFQQALIRCQALLTSSNQAVCQWAEQAMDVLEKRHAQLEKAGDSAKAENHTEQDIADERQQRLARSPFVTDASTLVDPMAIGNSDLAFSEPDISKVEESAIAENDVTTSDANSVETDLADLFEGDTLGVESALDTPSPQVAPSVETPTNKTKQSTDLTGFVPFVEESDTQPSTESEALTSEQISEVLALDVQGSDIVTADPVTADPTGFVAAPASESISESAQEFSGENSAQEFSEENADENPFVLPLDDLGESADEAPEDSGQTYPINADLLSNGIATSEGLETEPPITPQTDASASLSNDQPPSNQSSSAPQQSQTPLQPEQDKAPDKPSFDPDLVAALNISKPRYSKRKSSKASPGQSLSETPSERAKQWRPLKPTRQVEFWLSYGWTAIALVALLSILAQIALATANPIWQRISRITAPPRWLLLENHPTWVVIIGLGLVLIVAQWLLGWMLGQFYGASPLPERELERRSPETIRLLKRVCKQYGFPIPKLDVLPSQAPFSFSYGLLPRTSRIVVSQGFLTQLSDDEIASLYGAELGHIRQRDQLPLMLVIVIAQIPFLIYRYSAAWGDRRRPPFLREIAIALSSIAYGFFWLLRWPGLWLARTRQFQGDRHSVSITGNPNGLARALITVTKGMTQDIERQRATDFILDGLGMLMPVSPDQALPLGSLYLHQSSQSSTTAEETSAQSTSAQSTGQADILPSLVAWDTRNPHRKWLLINNSHPLIGERLKGLNQYAQQFRLRSDISLLPRTESVSANKAQPFWLQISPYIGPFVGMGLAIALWLVGGIAQIANVDQLEWLWRDMSLFVGCLAMGFSFGTLLRINKFFPDISPGQAKTETDLPTLLQNPNAIPLDSEPVQFEGRLLGRPGIGNSLGQDLMLRTEQGTLKLHWISPIGPLGNLILGKVRPSKLIGRPVTITGWFRRGATPWIDAEKIRVDGRTLAQSSHPLWSTLLAIATTLWGAYVIYRGTL